MADQAAPKKIKVKMLRQVGPHAAGAEVELDEAMAEDLCQPSYQMVGHVKQNLQKAIKLEDLAKIDESDIDISQMTQAEMDARGLVNRVSIASPFDTHPPQAALDNRKVIEEHAKKVDQKAQPVDTEDKVKSKVGKK